MEAKTRLEDSKAFIGLTEDAGRTTAKLQDVKFNISHKEEHSFLKTSNVDLYRINVTIKDGIIVEAYYG